MAEETHPHLGECLDELETVMVSLFRLFQSLFVLVKDERQYLVARDASVLEKMFAEKALVLSNIEQVEQERERKTGELAVLVKKQARALSLSELLLEVPDSFAIRIRHIQQGILSLQKEIREVNDGNFALANLNLQQVQAVQQFLINTLQPPSSFYGPNSKISQQTAPSTWQMDQNV